MKTSPWTKLQIELRDLAFQLDRRGSHAAADLAATVAARIGELIETEALVPAAATIPSPTALRRRAR